MSHTLTTESTLYDIALQRLDGQAASLRDYEGQLLLVVNTASACGLTPQYEGLEILQRSYEDHGFTVLGFPSNQFGAQEPGSAEEIAAFCSSRFDISFPLFAKTDVNGPGAHPLFEQLKQARPRPDGVPDIAWNFTKFLVGRDGQVLGRYEPKTPPAVLALDIERVLG